MKLLRLSLEDIGRLSAKLARKVRASGYKPDLLLGIARGGWVPARLLSDKLNNYNVANMRVEFYVAPGRTAKKAIVTQRPSVGLRGKKVLVIDDVADTGHSLVAAMKLIRRLKPKEVRVATLHYKPHSIFKPDYYVATTSKWIIYPWEVEEFKRQTQKKR